MKHYLKGEILAWPKVTHGKMMGCPFYLAEVHLVEAFIMGSRTTKKWVSLTLKTGELQKVLLPSIWKCYERALKS